MRGTLQELFRVIDNPERKSSLSDGVPAASAGLEERYVGRLHDASRPGADQVHQLRRIREAEERKMYALEDAVAINPCPALSLLNAQSVQLPTTLGFEPLSKGWLSRWQHPYRWEPPVPDKASTSHHVLPAPPVPLSHLLQGKLVWDGREQPRDGNMAR